MVDIFNMITSLVVIFAVYRVLKPIFLLIANVAQYTMDIVLYKIFKYRYNERAEEIEEYVSIINELNDKYIELDRRRFIAENQSHYYMGAMMNVFSFADSAFRKAGINTDGRRVSIVDNRNIIQLTPEEIKPHVEFVITKIKEHLNEKDKPAQKRTHWQHKRNTKKKRQSEHKQHARLSA